MNQLVEFCQLRNDYARTLEDLDRLADDIKHYASKEREAIRRLGEYKPVGGLQLTTGDTILRQHGQWVRWLETRLGYVKSLGKQINELLVPPASEE